MRSLEQIVSALGKHHYITDRPLATVLFLAQNPRAFWGMAALVKSLSVR